MNIYLSHLPSVLAVVKAPLINPSGDFISVIINMIILFLAMRHFLFRPVTEFMNKRTAEIEGSIKNADEKNVEANNLISKYENKIAMAHEEASVIQRNKIRAAEEKALEIIKGAEDEAKKIREKALKDIEREKVKTINEMKDEISSLALYAASKVIEKDLDEKTHGELIGKFISEVGGIEWQS